MLSTMGGYTAPRGAISNNSRVEFALAPLSSLSPSLSPPAQAIPRRPPFPLALSPLFSSFFTSHSTLSLAHFGLFLYDSLASCRPSQSSRPCLCCRSLHQRPGTQPDRHGVTRDIPSCGMKCQHLRRNACRITGMMLMTLSAIGLPHSFHTMMMTFFCHRLAHSNKFETLDMPS